PACAAARRRRLGAARGAAGGGCLPPGGPAPPRGPPPPLEGGMAPLPPLGDLPGVLVLGVAARRLGRVAPPLEVFADGPHRHVDPALLADQVAHRLAGPHRGGDAQLLGAVVVDQVLDVAGPLRREGPPRAPRAPPPRPPGAPPRP